MFNDGKDGANEGQQKLTRRASDKPHPFERNQGFRTCRACGLPKNHEIHDGQYPTQSIITDERQPQSIEDLRERFSDYPPPASPRFSLSDIAVVGGGLIVVATGLVFLALFFFNNSVDDPLQRILGNPGNKVVKANAHIDGLNSSILVFDLTEVSGSASRLDVFRSFLKYAEAMKERHFDKVILACRGVRKFTLEGAYFRQLGQEYKRDNFVSMIRTFPPHLEAMDGRKSFAEYSSDLLEDVTKGLAQFTEFSDQWYANDSASARTEVDSSSVVAAESCNH